MHLRKPKLRAFKGPMVVLALAATLIVALALPKATSAVEEKPTEFEIASKWEAEVKRLEVKVGDRVEIGTPLMVLIDLKLEADLLLVEAELKLATLGTKQAVVEEEISGLIGTLPRVVWTSPEPASVKGAPAKAIDSSSVDPKVGNLQVNVQSASIKAKELAVDVEAAEANLQQAVVALDLAETDARNAEQSLESYQKDWDKLQRLYDMGAIAKKKLDASVESFQTASADAAQKKQTVHEKQGQIADLQKDLADLKEQFAKASQQQSSLSTLLEVEKAKAAEVRKKQAESSPNTTHSTPTRRIVYGTAPENLAPLSVDLVEVDNPDQNSKIIELKGKIVELREKREALRITAPVAGYVKSIIEPGVKVANLDTLVVIAFTK